MSFDNANTNLSIQDLPAVLTNFFQPIERSFLPEAQNTVNVRVRYLRRKLERGLAVIYVVDDRNSRVASQHPSTSDAQRSVSLTIDEKALDGANIRFSAKQAQ